MMDGLTTERLAIGVGGFVLLLLIEAVCPFRRPVDTRWRRMLTNLFIIGSNALLLSVLLSGLIVAAHQTFAMQHWGLLYRLGAPEWLNLVATLIVLDGVSYFWHVAYHTMPWMWRMHRVHHSDLDLDVTSSGRFHLTEMCFSAVLRLGTIALLGSTFSSVVLFEILFGLLNQIEHSNIRLPAKLDSTLQWAFVTPDMHRIHHSQKLAHTNSNYGTVFSFWDRLCGTYRCGINQETLVLGLPEYSMRRDITIGRVLLMPFGRSCEAARRSIGAGNPGTRTRFD